MTGSVVEHLILKDWRLHRQHIAALIAGGALGLAILQVGSETATFFGGILFFLALIALGGMLPSSNIVNERKKQNLPFLMSLPISSRQYTTAKLASTLGMFFVPWLALLIGGVTAISRRSGLPGGIIPATLILVVFTLVSFCLITGVALVGESEGLTMAITVACNCSYGVIWWFVLHNPALTRDLKSPVAVWSPVVLGVLASEFASILLILGLTFSFQSRKRDFR